MVSFQNRGQSGALSHSRYSVKLQADTFEIARSFAKGWDIYAVEVEWREWVVDLLGQGMDPPRNPDQAFIGFCKKWVDRRS